MYDQVIADLCQSYDRAADERETYEVAAWKVEERGRFLDLLKREGKTRLLEIGAGTGRDGLFFQHSGLDVVCTDLSPVMVEHCRARGLTAYQMDFMSLDFPAGSFDGIYSLNCLLHVPKKDLPEVLGIVASLLRPDGVFFLGMYGGIELEGVWDKDSYEPKRFFAFYLDEQIQDVVAPLFEVLYFKPVPLPEDEAGMHFQSMILRRR